MDDVEFCCPTEKYLRLSGSQTVQYHSLCIATGALPKTIAKQPIKSVIQIRDTDTIEELQRRLFDAKRIVIVGDGGIALEVSLYVVYFNQSCLFQAAYELKNLEIYWTSKSAHVGTPFFDATLALALEERFKTGRLDGELKREVVVDKYVIQTTSKSDENNKATTGASLGPNWLAKLKQQPNQDQVFLYLMVVNVNTNVQERTLTIMRCLNIVNYHTEKPASYTSDDEWNVYVEFDDNQIIGCNFVIEVLGVFPNSAKWKEWCPEVNLNSETFN